MTIDFDFSKIATDDAGWAQECECSRGKGKGTAGGITSGSSQKSGKATQIQTTGIEGPKGSTLFAAQTKPSKDTPAPSSSSSLKLTLSAKAGLIGEVDHPSQKRILDLDDETDDEEKSAAPKKDTQSIKKKKKSKTATPVSAPAPNPVSRPGSTSGSSATKKLPNVAASPKSELQGVDPLSVARSSNQTQLQFKRVPKTRAGPTETRPGSIETQQKDEAAAIIIGLSDSEVRWPHSACFPLELAP